MSRIEEQITAIEYTRARYRMTHATSENEKIQMQSVVRWLGKKLDQYRIERIKAEKEHKKE